MKGALASPERAAKGDVKVGKRAKKIFKKTEEELRRWENWPTDAELRQEMLSRSEDRSKASAPAEHPEGAVEPQSGVGEQSAEDAGEREANVQAKQKLVQGTLNWENGKRYSLNTVNVPETPKDMPAPEDPKALRNWLKDFYKGKAKPVNSDTNWSISVPATGLKETLNHLYRKRGSYRRDLHFRSLTAIDSMLEQAKFDRFEDVQNEKKGDKVSIFNVLVDFGEDGIYNARMVVKHFGEDKNYYDHRLTKFEEVPIPRLLPEGSGRHSTSSDNTISSETEKSSGVEKKSDESDKADGKSYSLRRQVNPILEDGEIRREYQDLLNDRDYTPERIAEWDKTAIEWIERQGGIQNAAELIANSTEHNDRHVATLVRRHVMNSEVFRDLSPEVREEVEYQNLKEGTSWGREGAARRLAAMTLDSIERVRALFRRLHENMPDAEAQKLRNRVMDSTGVDVYNLPEDIVNDKAKLDEVLRAELASKSKWHDKAYEYWINAILSGPATHSVNVMGNTANGLYELGVKRFTEAALNTVFRRKDGATFGEFKEMWKAFDVKRAWGKALEAFNLETLTPAGKFRENQAVAIPGEVGRVVRLPGRLLTMADAFARELLIPVEASAQAYRAGKAQGLKGDALRKYIEAEIANPGSKAYQAGKASAERVIFQEEPGALVRQLVAMREGDGIGAQILKFTLPFIKTPANVLRQAVRKSPLGSVSLGIETGKLLLGKRKFDGDYIGRVAEQLLAWGAFLALGGLGDNDEPRITGSSAAYGSAEQKYKANRIPPYSLRIGDTWYSYQRLDPFATGLALIADASQALRDVRNGAEATGALKKMIQGTGKMLSEKSYLDSINQIYQFMENPEKSAMDFGTNFLSSWVPNVMRQASYAVDDYQRDYKSAGEGLEFLRDQMHVVTSKAGITRRVPKVDLWGREITKEEAEKVGNAADTVWRFLIPVKRVGVETDNPGERLIENWNARHPDETWWGSLPSRKVTVNGERVELSGEEYHDYAVKAGRMAYKQMMNAVRRGLLHPDDPTEADIKLLKQIFRRARRTVKVSP